MLPLDLSFAGYGDNEKIAYLPHKLIASASTSFGNEAPGDLAYYVPWGNFIIFCGDHSYSPGLVRLGRVEASLAPFLGQESYTARIELAE